DLCAGFLGRGAEQRRDLDGGSRLGGLAPCDGEGTCLILGRRAPGTLGGVERCALGCPRSLVAQLRVAGLSASDRDQELLCDREGDEAVMRKCGLLVHFAAAPFIAPQEPLQNEQCLPARTLRGAQECTPSASRGSKRMSGRHAAGTGVLSEE